MDSIIIRVGQGTLAFLCPDGNNAPVFRPYPVKSGMSIAANLRTAFKEESYLTGVGNKAVLLVSSPTLLIPTEQYQADETFDADEVYGNVITGHKGEVKVISDISELYATAVFPVNSDLQMVVKDHFPIVDTRNVMVTVWQHLYNRYYESGKQRRLFAYFHDKVVDICSFGQHRIHFANSFPAVHAHDALYYTLFIWKQLGMNQTDDELFIFGDMPHADWLLERYNTYLSHVNVIDHDGKADKKPFDLTLCEEY